MVGEFQTPTEKFTHITACKAAIEALFQTPTEKFTRNAPRISAVVTAFQTPTEKFTRGVQQPLASLSEVSNSNGEIYTYVFVHGPTADVSFKLQRREFTHWAWYILFARVCFKLQRREFTQNCKLIAARF